MKKLLGTQWTKKGDVRQKLRFILNFLCLVLCVLSLNSCLYKKSDPLSYRSFPFKASITAVGFDTDFKANVTVTSIEEGGKASFVFDFLSPEILQGIEAELRGERIRIRLKGTVFTDTEFPANQGTGLLRIAELLSPSEPILSIKSISGIECGLPHIKALTAVTTPTATVYISPESSLPVKARDNESGAFLMIEPLPNDG